MTLPQVARSACTPKYACAPPRMAAETRDNLVENQGTQPACAVISRNACKNSRGCKSGLRLCTGSTRIGGEFVRVGTQQFQTLRPCRNRPRAHP